MPKISVQGWGLLLIAFVWSVLGAGIIGGASAPASGQALWHLIVPADIRAFLWLASSAVAACGAFCPRVAPIALKVAIVMPLVRFTSYGWAWVVHLIGRDGHRFGWYSAAFYLAMIGLVVLVAAIRPARLVPDPALIARILKPRPPRGDVNA